MKRKAGILFFACAVLFAGVLFVPRSSTGQEGKGQGSIVFVDLKGVIDEYEKTHDIEKKIDGLRQTRLDEIQKKKEQQATMAEEMKLLNPGSTTYLKMWQEYEKQKLLIKHEEDCLKRETQAALLRSTKEIYEDIAAFCEKYRKEKEYLAVVKIEGSEITSESKGELVLKINSRSIVASDPAYEITADVIRELNAKYKKD